MANEWLGDALVVWEANVTFVARPAVGVAGIAGVAACCAILCVVVERRSGDVFGLVRPLFDCPLWVSVERKGIANAFILLFFGFSGRWND